MAHEVAGALRRHQPSSPVARILDLGLGGGTFIGHLLCHTDARNRVHEVVAVDISTAVARIAEEAFFPVIFNGSCGSQRSKVRVVVGDAFALVSAGGELHGGETFDAIVLDIDPVGEGACGRQPAVAAMRGFFTSLGQLTARDDTILVINVIANLPACGRTQADQRQQVRRVLERVLRAAGWSELRDTAVAIEERIGFRIVHDLNVLVIASAFVPWWRPAVLWARMTSWATTVRDETSWASSSSSSSSSRVYAAAATSLAMIFAIFACAAAALWRVLLDPYDDTPQSSPRRSLVRDHKHKAKAKAQAAYFPVPRAECADITV